MPKKVTTSKGLKGSTFLEKKTMLWGQKKICQPGSLHYFILTAGFRQLIQLQVCCETSPVELNLVRLYSRKLGTAVICGFVFPKNGFLFQKTDLFSEKRIFFFSLVFLLFPLAMSPHTGNPRQWNVVWYCIVWYGMVWVPGQLVQRHLVQRHLVQRTEGTKTDGPIRHLVQ